MRYLSALLDSNGIREEILKGRSYLVVPVVMMVGDIVVHPANAEYPEFVPSSVLQASLISGWNGRPIVSKHPQNNTDTYVSASSSAEVIESYHYGFLLNTSFSNDNKLKSEMWIDIAEANRLGGDALSALTKIQSGEMIDVSIGAIVETEETIGTLGDKEYHSIWVSVESDHLATLPNQEGACNQLSGCGAPRVMLAKKEEEIIVAADTDKLSKPKLTFFQKVFSKFRSAEVFDDGESDEDLRSKLYKVIRAAEPAFDWICRVYSDKNTVVYSTYVIFGGSYDGEMRWWRRTYQISSTGEITLNDDRIEVRLKEVWETVDTGEEITAASVAVKSEPCSCQKGENTMAIFDRKALVGKLIACGNNKFTEKDRAGLEALSEETLQSLDVVEEKKEETKVEASTPVVETSANSSRVLTREEIFAADPELKSMVDGYKLQQLAAKKSLIACILPAQSRYDEAQLNQKSITELEDISALLNLDKPQVTDYSLRGIPSNPTQTKTLSDYTPPKIYGVPKQAAN